MRTKDELTHLFGKVGVADPAQWAAAEVAEDLGNLPRATFLRQLWNEIPRTGDSAWLEAWIDSARHQPSEAGVVSAYERIMSGDATHNDLVALLRGVMSQFLYRIAYLLDDPSIEDSDLKEAVSWGLYEESDGEEPIRRLGCIHELVFSVDPEYDGS
jgi:hypothetical protein